MTNNLTTFLLNSADFKATAQVAVEAILNMPDAYDFPTMMQVRETGIAAGVSNTYMDPLRILMADRF